MTLVMKTSDDGIRTLIDSEGSESTVYMDQAGLPTIGVGHCMTQSEVSSGKIELSDGSIIDLRNNRISKRNITRLLRDDLISREAAVNKLVKVPLEQSQFDALVHFVFNVGVGGFKNSTLLKKLNNGSYNAVPDEIRKWNIVTVGGKKQVSNGLANRREVECSMWESCETDTQKNTSKPTSSKKSKRRKSKPTRRSKTTKKARVASTTEKPASQSKVIGMAVATALAYLGSKYGLDIPTEWQSTIESIIVVGGLAGIGVIRRWFTHRGLV